MGACGGKLTEEQLRNKRIETEMAKDKIVDESKIKILLLGAGESGKSTLFKQMKILFTALKNFTDDERESFVDVIHGNILSDMRAVITYAEEKGELAGDPNVEAIKKWEKRKRLRNEEKQILNSVWTNEVIVNIWENRGHVQVQDALEYYMDRIEQVCQPGYSPTNEDILRSRVRTTGVVQEKFQMGEARFEMYDVGGQRNERRKWIHSFENVTTVMFVAAVSEYNQYLYEDNNKHRQEEAVELFRQQLCSQWFLDVPFILFLNKKDLFREKLPKIPFKVTEGDEQRNIDFQGPECEMDRSPPYNTDGSDSSFENCYDAALEYLKDIYVSQQDDLPVARKAGIYTHFTNSTDSENVERIMNSCKDIILRIQLSKFGWVHNN
mmetsp:Transcript_15440/g.19114  ORF Transcript_15440/g.19114 Transcript_15440/m.19114 type:complete len:381 (+) Transcript_15440:305-1447(+)|eukprot:CAMPEP_0204828682 /NCGR_PEP_ID=MMETSP1346-20131115/6576_1 /ASSEMBLY_ACC=CAM_ASM_000771 /TAXON_ID=215587 /ORGANISM="Aplanochytrium stocchinoi, Strain GSBS06" /LENGTH=380 /DNA_ID=CAMNT_0051957947 /DNA_START=218 /DNA_END=1360 /DNA_ORIENTATION=+